MTNPTNELDARGLTAIDQLRLYAHDPETFQITLDDIAENLVSEIDALSNTAPAGVRVKKLEWTQNVQSGLSLWTGELAFGTYYVAYDEGSGWRVFRKQFLSEFEDEIAYGDKDMIFAAAQADFERRIREWIEPSPADQVSEEFALNEEELETIEAIGRNKQTGRLINYEIKELVRVYRAALQAAAAVRGGK